MNKKHFVTLFLFACLTVGFSSCKKCVTCRIERLDGTVEAQYDEYCGTSTEVEDFKNSVEAKSEDYLGQNGKVICTEN